MRISDWSSDVCSSDLAYVDAGVPAGAIQLVYGIPSEISEYLISHPVIRKITFTGSTPVGKHLAMLAGQHIKRITIPPGISYEEFPPASHSGWEIGRAHV